MWEECTSWGREKGWQEVVEKILGEEWEGMDGRDEGREGNEEIGKGVNEEGMVREENTAEMEV